MKIVVSACLLGHNCKYNGRNNYNQKVADLAKEHTLIPVCPEMAGGLPCPRACAEICGDSVVTAGGEDVTAQFEKGRDICMELVRKEKPDAAILQPRSPSCGTGKIYDGTFSGTLTEGNGLFAQTLLDEKIPVLKADSI